MLVIRDIVYLTPEQWRCVARRLPSHHPTKTVQMPNGIDQPAPLTSHSLVKIGASGTWQDGVLVPVGGFRRDEISLIEAAFADAAD